MQDFRCPRCGRLLARVGGLGDRGVVQVKCKGCHTVAETSGDRVEVLEQAPAQQVRVVGDAAQKLKGALAR